MKRSRAAGASSASAPATLPRAGAALHLVTVSPGAPAVDPFGASPRALLAAYTHGLAGGPEAFLSSHFRRHAVAFVGGGAARVARLKRDLFADGSVQSLAATTASERIHAWLPGGAASAASAGAPSGERTTLDSLKLEDAAAAMTAYRAGGSLYFRSSPQAARELVPRFAEAVCGALPTYYAGGAQEEPRGEVEVLASRRGHKTHFHADFQENFTFQLSGSKTWRLVRSAQRSPVRGSTPHFETPSELVEAQVKAHRSAGDAAYAFWPGAQHFEGADVVTLQAGDLLYFPAGLWHEVSATSDSLSINVSIDALSWAELGGSAVRHLLHADDAWRQGATTIPLAILPPLEPPPVWGAGGSGPGAGSSSSSSSGRSDAALVGRGLPAHLHAHMEGLLGRLRAAVSALQPWHLLPPCALLSLRWGGVPRVPAGLGGSSDEEEEEVGEEEEEGGEGSSEDSRADDGESRLAALVSRARGHSPHFMLLQRGFRLHILAESSSAQAAPAAPLRVRLNPLATLLREEADVTRHASRADMEQSPMAQHAWVPRLVDAARASAPAASGGSGKRARRLGASGVWVAYLAHTVACGDEDLTSRSRVTLHVPEGPLLAVMDALVSATATGGRAGTFLSKDGTLLLGDLVGHAEVDAAASLAMPALEALLEALEFAGILARVHGGGSSNK